jgi:hypothetical protein
MYFIWVWTCRRSRGSIISVVSAYWLDDRAIQIRSPVEAKYFSSNLSVQTGSGAHQASSSMGSGGPFPGEKARPLSEADRSPPSLSEIINE